MAYVWQRWLIPELRKAAEPLGIRVIVVEGAENRGRPASTGDYDPNGAHTVHHTGATTSDEHPALTVQTCIIGRPDLPGPLVQVLVAHNGDIYVIACGRCNHAGEVGKSGVLGMPLGADGNALSIGDEVDTNGTQPLPPEQIRSIALVGKVVTEHDGHDVAWIHRHEDISATGKWDIGNRSTAQLREDARSVEEDDMQFKDEYAKGKTFGSLLRRLDRFLTATGPRLQALADDLDKALDKVSDDASREQVRNVGRSLRALADEIAADQSEDPPPGA